MLKKYALFLGIILAITLLSIAALNYPGGSQYDKNSIGYDWKKNYLSNLFTPAAVNGSANGARPWAIGGMFFLCMSFALFFYRFSKKISSRSAANIIKYAGGAGMLFAFLAVTPYHDLMITLAATGALISIFYITVFVFQSRLFYLKILAILLLLAAYSCNYLYYTRTHLEILPVMQKVAVFLLIVWSLCLEHLTTAADFPPKKKFA